MTLGLVLFVCWCTMQFMDLEDPTLAPPGWDKDVSPPLFQWTDISLYELHVRDFR